MDCYLKLKRDMNKVTNAKKKNSWTQWEEDGNERILDDKTFKTNRTFIGLGVESEEECAFLQSQDYDNIVFTNCTNIPDMKAITGTQKIFQVDGHSTRKDDGTYRLDLAQYSCSCSECRKHSGIDKCLHKNDRHVKTVYVK